MIGNSETGNVPNFTADVNLVATGFHTETSIYTIKDWLSEKKDLNVLDIEQLTRPEVVDKGLVNRLTVKFKVRAKDLEKAMDPNTWPRRISVRHFRQPRKANREKKKTRMTESWVVKKEGITITTVDITRPME